MTDAILWSLANAVAIVTVAGAQVPVLVTPLGRTFDTDRRVRVERSWDEDEERAVVRVERWEGPVEVWTEALREALFRGFLCYSSPGRYELAALAEERAAVST